MINFAMKMVMCIFTFALVLCLPAMAQSSSELIPTTICDGAGNCSLPVGGWVALVLTHSLPIAVALIGAIYAYLLRSLPTGLAGVLKTFRVDQLLVKAVEYGIAMVVGATKEKKWDVTLGSSIVSQAIIYALTKMPGWMKAWIGPLDNLVDMIIARIQPFLEDGVDGNELKASVISQVNAGTPTTSVSAKTSLKTISAVAK